MPGTVRDHLWLFACVAGADDDSLGAGGVPVGSRMTPVEGALYLGTPNLIMVRCGGRPEPPYDQYALPFRSLDRQVWSIVGSGGRQDDDELGPVLDLAAGFPNLCGVFLDDFFIPDPDGGPKWTGAMSPQQLQKLRPRLQLKDRRLETWVTFYSRALDPTHPGHFEIDGPPQRWLDHFDVITLWTRGEDRLKNLPTYLDRLEALSPGARKMIGCDFWDFVNKAPVPVELMQFQCELGLEWLRQGRIDGMIFLANTTMDVGLESSLWARQWIAEVGEELV